MSETVHATALIIGTDGVLLRGTSGSGKSTLALDLIARASPARFAALVSDDRTELSARNSRLIARAPAPIGGLIEIRGIGIVEMPSVLAGCTVSLVVELVGAEDFDRMPEPETRTVTLCGLTLPRLRLPAHATPAMHHAAISAALRPEAHGVGTATERTARN